MSIRSVLTSLVLTAVPVLGAPALAQASAPIEARSVISHDAVTGFTEAVPDSVAGTLMLKYKPKLKVTNGCVPFPAVDAEGNTSGGLKPTGSSNGHCSSSTGQVYARAATHGEYFAIMYSCGLGHRYDWEEAIAWLSGETADAALVAFSLSAHGGISSTRSPGRSGDSPLAEYASTWPLNHQLLQTTTVGGTQPLIAWENLTDAARDALQTTDFGKAMVPFKDSVFIGNLEKGYATL
ncbi:hypothetical protein INS49_005251 [Diaporthe citri]|uniref:uncharacterized protein n=1 Tax=Diaporthe citri TaxID=83186 RepID=UPI001C81ADDB|nr:uncharacterized protein INS49_005251 [Diaporthe citri]KAG6353772.1 hypothetical protein INS49_005251 [Diaporthe citri]